MGSRPSSPFSSDRGVRPFVGAQLLRSLGGVHRAFVVHERRREERLLFVPDEVVGDEALVGRGVSAGESVVIDPPARVSDGLEVAP